MRIFSVFSPKEIASHCFLRTLSSSRCVYQYRLEISPSVYIFDVKTCAGTAQSKIKRGLSHQHRFHSREFAGVKRAGLVCPSTLVQTVSIVDQSLKGTSSVNLVSPGYCADRNPRIQN